MSVNARLFPPRKFPRLPILAGIGASLMGVFALGVLRRKGKAAFVQSNEAVRLEVDERERTEQALSKTRERLQGLSRQLVEAQEAERKQLAAELHDRIGQNLTALNINLNVMLSELPAEAAEKVRTRVNDSLNLVDQTVESVRDVMAELRPVLLDDYGLVAALRWYCEQFTRRTGIVAVAPPKELSPRLPPEIEAALFRIAQEALTNAAKHAGAKRVAVTLQADSTATRLTIADDGSGLTPDDVRQSGKGHGWGLVTMRERAEAIGADLRIESGARRGTGIVVDVPRSPLPPAAEV